MIVSELFNKEPKQWGLRGDPFLWADMMKSFEMEDVEISVQEFQRKLISIFEERTGMSIMSDESIFVEKYAHGGISSGYICTITWREKLIPYLVNNLKKYKEINCKDEN